MLNTGKNLQEFKWVLAGISCCTSQSFKLESLSCCVGPQSKCSRRSDVCGEALSCGFVFRRKLCESAFGYCKSPMPKSFRALLRFSQIFWFWHCFPCCYFLSSVISTNSFCKKTSQQCQQKPPNEQKNKQTPNNNNTNPTSKNDEQKWNKKTPNNKRDSHTVSLSLDTKFTTFNDEDCAEMSFFTCKKYASKSQPYLWLPVDHPVTCHIYIN